MISVSLQKMLDELAYGDVNVVTCFKSDAARIKKLDKLVEMGLVQISSRAPFYGEGKGHESRAYRLV